MNEGSVNFEKITNIKPYIHNIPGRITILLRFFSDGNTLRTHFMN